MYRFLICDDDINQVNIVEQFISQYCEKKQIEFECTKVNSGEEALQKFNYISYDIVCLDIEMVGINGLEATDVMKDLSDEVIIIYITAYTRFAFDAFDRHVFNYITKPIDKFRFNVILEDALKQTEKNKGNNIVVADIEGSVLTIENKDVLFFEKYFKNIKIYLASGNVENIKCTFLELAQKINNNIFIRCHKGYIINITKIDKLKGDKIYLKGLKISIPIGRTYKKIFTEKYVKVKKIN